MVKPFRELQATVARRPTRLHPGVLAAAVHVLCQPAAERQPPSLAEVMTEKAGVPLASLTLVSVPPEHEHAPARKRFNVVGTLCYVLHEDYPALKAALARQRAKR